MTDDTDSTNNNTETTQPETTPQEPQVQEDPNAANGGGFKIHSKKK